MMKAEPDSSDSLVFECDLEEPPEKVWRALTDPLLLEAWLSTDALPVTRSGADSAERASAPTSQQVLPLSGMRHGDDRNDHGARQAGSSEYEILTAEPHKRVRYRWRDRESEVSERPGREVYSIVTVEIAPCPEGGTHLRLTHGDFRIVSLAPMGTSARIMSIMNAPPRRAARRWRTAIVSSAAQVCLRWAA